MERGSYFGLLYWIWGLEKRGRLRMTRYFEFKYLEDVGAIH